MAKTLPYLYRELKSYVQLASGVRTYLRTPLHKDPEALVRSQVERRESIFLHNLDQVVFSNPHNPYRQMFDEAGCARDDFAQLVAKDGLDSALQQVRCAGVYLSQDEFKGNVQIVRGRRQIATSPESFRNPLAHGTIRVSSTGSRGKPSVTFRSPAFLLDLEAIHQIVTREFDLAKKAQLILRSTLPSLLGIQACAAGVRMGHRMEAWYATGSGGHYAPLTAALVWMARRSGCRIPYPTYIPDNDFRGAAEVLARLRRAGISCMISGPASPAVRLAAAALNGGLDIRDTLFLVSGETLTDAKRAVLVAAGGQAFVRYGISEMGFIGNGCRQMTEGACVHLYSNALAAINHRRRAPLADVDVDSLLFTTLLPSAPNFLINFEVNDSGILERTNCDCAFSSAGLNYRIRDIFSFGKLTGQGMTLIGTEIVRLLEEVLPAALGGYPGDFQLIERESATQTAIELRVSPRLNRTPPEKIRECFLSELQKLYGGSLAARVWRHAEAVQVVMKEPIVTSTGKVNPLHLLGLSSDKRG